MSNSTGDNWMGCLQGLIQNAAKSYARFLRNGDEVRHDWTDEMNVDRGLPLRIEDVPAHAADPKVAALAAQAMEEADAHEAILIGQ